MVLSICSTANAEKQAEQKKIDYWEELHKAAGLCYDESTFRADLVSWKDKQEVKMNKIKFISIGAEVIEDIESARLKLEVMVQKKEKLKSALTQDGLQGILALFDVLEQEAETKAKLNVAENQFKGILRICGKK